MKKTPVTLSLGAHRAESLPGKIVRAFDYCAQQARAVEQRRRTAVLPKSLARSTSYGSMT